jgi:hypothetical protein
MEADPDDSIAPPPPPPFDPAIHLHSPNIEASHKALIENLRSNLESWDNYDSEWCSDHLLMLFLIARNYDIDATTAMLKTASEWRSHRRPHEVEAVPDWEAKMSRESQTGKVYVPGNYHGSIRYDLYL